MPQNENNNSQYYIVDQEDKMGSFSYCGKMENKVKIFLYSISFSSHQSGNVSFGQSYLCLWKKLSKTDTLRCISTQNTLTSNYYLTRRSNSEEKSDYTENM